MLYYNQEKFAKAGQDKISRALNNTLTCKADRCVQAVLLKRFRFKIRGILLFYSNLCDAFKSRKYNLQIKMKGKKWQKPVMKYHADNYEDIKLHSSR